MRPTDILRTYAPDFCWLTFYDLLLLAEQVDEDINVNSFRTLLYDLTIRGEFITKPDPWAIPPKGCTAKKRSRLYMRVSGVTSRPPLERPPLLPEQAAAEHSGEQRPPLSIGR